MSNKPVIMQILDWINENIFWIIIFFLMFGGAISKFILNFTSTLSGNPTPIEQVQEPKKEKVIQNKETKKDNFESMEEF